MAKYVLRFAEVEARQHEGPGAIIVNSVKKGEQKVLAGDFLVTDKAVVDKAKAAYDENAALHPEIDWSLEENAFRAPQGSIYAMSKDVFLADFELANPVEVPVEVAAVPVTFEVGEKVHFAESTGNDTSIVYTVDGVHPKDEQGQTFYSLEGDAAGLYLASSLEPEPAS